MITGPTTANSNRVLTPEAIDFLADLHHRFDGRRRELLAMRTERPPLAQLAETSDIRRAEWTVAAAPVDLVDRRVEITGPVDRKMVINALNSGAKAFMADFEDANSPTWENVVEGQANLVDAVRRTISFDVSDKHYSLGGELATLMVRPRGWHLEEKHLLIDGKPIAAALFDFGLYFFHNSRHLTDVGSGPYFYLPKLESHLEARLWNSVFDYSQTALGIPPGTVRATVLIETLPAAFVMEEILFELRDHSGGLNAGRWDYIFSVIKNRRHEPTALLPDRSQVSMTVPFMKAYTDRLVATCHRREAYAIGGMAAFIPNRHDEELNQRAFASVRADKEREAQQGFDGTWVAHPGLIEVAQAAFDQVLDPGTSHQFDRMPEPPPVTTLLDVSVPDGTITEEGLRTNIRVGILYLVSWLRGTGAAALFNLMEDAATAEISRSQVWQWVKHGARLDDGRLINRSMVNQMIEAEMSTIESVLADTGTSRIDDAVRLFTDLALSDELAEFLTLSAYNLIE